MEGLWPGAQVGQRSTCKGSGQSRLPGTQAGCPGPKPTAVKSHLEGRREKPHETQEHTVPMGLPERGLSTAVLMPGKSKGVRLGGS